MDYDQKRKRKEAVNLDNAVTTPPFVKVTEAIMERMEIYGSIRRGTGQKSKYSSELYTGARKAVLDFVGADSKRYEVIFVNCTTDGMNKLASALIGSHRDMVLATRMEHHA